jgi:hypothetical protein
MKRDPLVTTPVVVAERPIWISRILTFGLFGSVTLSRVLPFSSAWL